MSKLYATIESDSRKNPATSQGNRRITTHATCWHGAVRVDLRVTDSGDITYEVQLVPWRGCGVRQPITSGNLYREEKICAREET